AAAPRALRDGSAPGASPVAGGVGGRATGSAVGTSRGGVADRGQCRRAGSRPARPLPGSAGPGPGPSEVLRPSRPLARPPGGAPPRPPADDDRPFPHRDERGYGSLALERAAVGAHLSSESLPVLTQLSHCLGKTEGCERGRGRSAPGPGRAGSAGAAGSGLAG